MPAMLILTGMARSYLRSSATNLGSQQFNGHCGCFAAADA